MRVRQIPRHRLDVSAKQRIRGRDDHDEEAPEEPSGSFRRETTGCAVQRNGAASRKCA